MTAKSAAVTSARRRLLGALAIFALAGLTGCATYGNSDSQRLTAETALVSAQSVSSDDTVRFVLLRAAEETLSAGHDWFRIERADGAGTVLTTGQDELQRILSPLDWCKPLCPFIGALGPMPNAQVLIRMGKGAAPEGAFAAHEVASNLGGPGFGRR